MTDRGPCCTFVPSPTDTASAPQAALGFIAEVSRKCFSYSFVTAALPRW
jgi:hypothetical protein